MRKYKFDWEFIGTNEIEDSRPNLGMNTSLEVYRLFQFTVRDMVEQRYGTEITDEIFREAGVLAGKAFFQKYCNDAKDVGALAKIIQEKFRDLAIGIVRFEKVDLDTMIIQLTVDEDLDCSGLSDSQEQVCVYDEGLIKGIFQAFTGKDFTVKEIDCWRSGERTCRFLAKMN